MLPSSTSRLERRGSEWVLILKSIMGVTLKPLRIHFSYHNNPKWKENRIVHESWSHSQTWTIPDQPSIAMSCLCGASQSLQAPRSHQKRGGGLKHWELWTSKTWMDSNPWCFVFLKISIGGDNCVVWSVFGLYTTVCTYVMKLPVRWISHVDLHISVFSSSVGDR